MAKSYRSLIFDCDGVVLDSNRVKTSAFYQAALPYGEDLASQLVEYHTANGGISRYRKFAYFLESIVQTGADEGAMATLLDSYASAVRAGLRSCAVTDGLEDLRQAFPDMTWYIASGGDQAELRDVFSERGLDQLFDGGIFGSPDTKEQILEREIAAGLNAEEALFIGDSRYDHIAAEAFAIDFIFASGWTEFSGWQDYTRDHSLPIIGKVAELKDVLQPSQTGVG